MTRLIAIIAPITLIGLLAIPLMAQNPATKPALTPSQALLACWSDIGRKLIAVAEDFPEDKYDFKPVPAQRSFADQLLHVAGSNDLFTQVAKGQKPVDDESRAHYPTKATVIAYLKKSVAEGAAVIQAKGDQGLTGGGFRVRTNAAGRRPGL